MNRAEAMAGLWIDRAAAAHREALAVTLEALASVGPLTWALPAEALELAAAHRAAAAALELAADSADSLAAALTRLEAADREARP